MPHARSVWVLAPLLVACSSPAASDPFGEETDGAQSASTCDMAGTWATFVEAGVEWSSGTISPGAGLVKQWILSKRTVSGGVVQDSARACGIGARGVKLGSPWFATNSFGPNIPSEWLGVSWLPQLFDNGLLPETPLTIQIRSATSGRASLGDDMSVGPAPFEFGTEGLHGDAPWPMEPAGIQQYLTDPDGDGVLGVAALPYEGPVPGEPEGVVFNFPRLDVTNEVPHRAKRLSLALRSRAGLTGKLVSCDPPRFEGTLVPDTLLIEIRSASCTVVQTDGPCTEDENAFIDDNLPKFTRNNRHAFVSIKVHDDITCEEVRNLDFTPLTLPPLDDTTSGF